MAVENSVPRHPAIATERRITAVTVPLPVAELRPPFSARAAVPCVQEEGVLLSATHVAANGGLEKGKQAVVDAAPLTDLESLPTLSASSYEPFLANSDINGFLKEDLDLSRLNRIHTHLWMCGRPMRARPLHRYKMLGTEVLPTQQLDLHLLKFSNKIILKPLPEHYLSHSFWTSYLCADEALHKAACGFLLSWVWLVTSPVDLRLAHELYLLPPWVTWPWWKTLVTEFVASVDIFTLHQVNPREPPHNIQIKRIRPPLPPGPRLINIAPRHPRRHHFHPAIYPRHRPRPRQRRTLKRDRSPTVEIPTQHLDIDTSPHARNRPLGLDFQSPLEIESVVQPQRRVSGLDFSLAPPHSRKPAVLQHTPELRPRLRRGPNPRDEVVVEITRIRPIVGESAQLGRGIHLRGDARARHAAGVRTPAGGVQVAGSGYDAAFEEGAFGVGSFDSVEGVEGGGGQGGRLRAGDLARGGRGVSCGWGAAV
ncbi:hypothetical protein GRF29_28g2863643 [Pseudopithomyces chartarum]|uniref:Uncharacterized protein n=1 Tax=Pseudopithomyces chartarum TaxID=1892770 RepID=A0AAN6M5A2_9PLEO|nr:hypothetical protein GRF29_28g2863643 [Pseudopithomyces chartarum]